MNVYPAEIEGVPLAHPRVTDVAVVGVPSAKWGESPLAAIVAADLGLDERTVLEHCHGKLAVLREQYPLDAPESSRSRP